MNGEISQKIFVVDLDVFSLAITQQHLKNLKCTDVATAENELACAAKLAQNPRIIFLDYRTDPKRGLEVLKQFKKLNPDTYIIFIVGPSGIIEALYSLHHGAFEYIIKDKEFVHSLDKCLKNIQHIEQVIYAIGAGK